MHCACLVWIFQLIIFSHFLSFFLSNKNSVNSLHFSSLCPFPAAIEYLLPSNMCFVNKRNPVSKTAMYTKDTKGKGGVKEWNAGLFGGTRGEGVDFFLWCESEIYFFLLWCVCKVCFFSFFCGEPVGTAEWDGMIPEVNAISLGHTQTQAGVRWGR